MLKIQQWDRRTHLVIIHVYDGTWWVLSWVIDVCILNRMKSIKDNTDELPYDRIFYHAVIRMYYVVPD